MSANREADARASPRAAHERTEDSLGQQGRHAGTIVGNGHVEACVNVSRRHDNPTTLRLRINGVDDQVGEEAAQLVVIAKHLMALSDKVTLRYNVLFTQLLCVQFDHLPNHCVEAAWGMHGFARTSQRQHAPHDLVEPPHLAQRGVERDRG